MKRIGVRLEPLDLLFFRGGLPMSEGIRAKSVLPSPQTFAGMIRTMLLERCGANFDAMRGKPTLAEACDAAGAGWVAQVRMTGPFPAIVNKSGVEPVFPCPANIRKVRGSSDAVGLLLPSRAAVPGWSPPMPGMLPLCRGGARFQKESPEWITWTGLQAYLCGEPLKPDHFRRTDELLEWEERTGVGIDPQTHASKEGILYTTRSLRLKPGVVFYGEIELPEERAPLVSGVAVWGGERRRVRLSVQAPLPWPSPAKPARSLILVLTPAFFGRQWLPGAIPDGALRAAAVTGPYAISGWDLARGGPRPVRFGVNAGSVYFCEGWEPEGNTLAENQEDALAGYGFFVKGTWNYAQ